MALENALAENVGIRDMIVAVPFSKLTQQRRSHPFVMALFTLPQSMDKV